jgi:hypothetical protein
VYLYLFVLDGRPAHRTELHMAQAVLEDHLRTRRDVSDVWWPEDNPYVPRVYLYGGSHSDYEANEAAGVDAMESDISWEEQDQLIWPVEIEPHAVPAVSSPLDLLGTKMTLSVVTSTEKAQMTRVIPESEWSEKRIQPFLITMFATEAARGVAEALRSKEGS